jgi:endoplasmic reticulum Man9GlcNAc2 1,2-alpha-mannosidase
MIFLLNLPIGIDLLRCSNNRHNIQRPETVESLFILYRLTGDPKYREWGWKIFEAFEKWERVPNGGGYTSLDDVTKIPPTKRDAMESFWMVYSLVYYIDERRKL